MLLRQASLLDYFYLLETLPLFLPACFVGKGNIWLVVLPEIVEWKLDTDMMMCKKSSDAHLFSHDIIDFSAQCFLPYAQCYLAIAQSFRLFCRRLNANFTEDGPRGYV